MPFLAIPFLFVSHFKKKIRASLGNLSNFVWGCSIANAFFGRNSAKSQRFDEWPWICRRPPILCTAWIDSQLRGSKSWEGRSVTMFSLKKPRKSGFSCFAEMFFNQFTVYVFFCNFVVEDGKTCCLCWGWRDYDFKQHFIGVGTAIVTSSCCQVDGTQWLTIIDYYTISWSWTNIAPSEWLTYPKKRTPKRSVFFLQAAKQALALRISSDHQSNSPLLGTEVEFVDPP